MTNISRNFLTNSPTSDLTANLIDKILLRKCGLIETVIDQLKDFSQIEHTCHCSPFNFVINMIAGMIAYCLQPRKPFLNIDQSQPLFVAYSYSG